jgi:hypothetical protein
MAKNANEAGWPASPAGEWTSRRRPRRPPRLGSGGRNASWVNIAFRSGLPAGGAVDCRMRPRSAAVGRGNQRRPGQCRGIVLKGIDQLIRRSAEHAGIEHLRDRTVAVRHVRRLAFIAALTDAGPERITARVGLDPPAEHRPAQAVQHRFLLAAGLAARLALRRAGGRRTALRLARRRRAAFRFTHRRRGAALRLADRRRSARRREPGRGARRFAAATGGTGLLQSDELRQRRAGRAAQRAVGGQRHQHPSRRPQCPFHVASLPGTKPRGLRHSPKTRSQTADALPSEQLIEPPPREKAELSARPAEPRRPAERRQTSQIPAIG